MLDLPLPPLEQIIAEIVLIERSFASEFERAKNNLEQLKGTTAVVTLAIWKAGFVAGRKSAATENSSN